MSLNIETTVSNIKEIVATSGLKILMALFILFLGLKIAKFITNKIDEKLQKQNIDESLRPFLNCHIFLDLYTFTL
jgi:hypothetical protein